MRHLVSAIIGIPALGALIVAVIPVRSGRVPRVIAFVTSSVALLLSLLLWVRFEPRGLQWQFLDELQWLPSMGIGYVVGVDGLGALVLLLAAAVTWVGILVFSDTSDRLPAAHAATLALEAGVLGAVASLSFVVFALFWIVAMTAASSLAPRFVRFASAATIALLVGIGVLVFALHGLTGSYTFDLRAFQQITLPFTTQLFVFALFLAAFAIVGGAVPLHAAHRDVIAETPIAAWIPVGVVLANLSTFGMMRLALPILPEAARAATWFLTWFFAGGMLWAIWLGLRQPRLERFVAYVSVAHATCLLAALAWPSPVQLTVTTISLIGHSALMLALAMTIVSMNQRSMEDAVASPPRRLAWSVGALALLAIGGVIYPTAILARIETSIARIVLRASPEHAAEVKDCLTASQLPPPPPDIPGLPAGAAMAAPCDTTQSEKK